MRISDWSSDVCSSDLDLVLIPAQPSPFDGWASSEMLRLLDEARIFRPELRARMLLNRCAARTVIARETAEALADQAPPMLASRGGQPVEFADAARIGRLPSESDTRQKLGRAARRQRGGPYRLSPGVRR